MPGGNGIGLDRLLDLGAAATPVGLGLGRLANFINGELYGRETYLPWAFVFPNDLTGLPRHPSQLYEFFLEGVLLFAVINYAVYRYKILTKPGRAAGMYALIYGFSRIVVEFVREPDAQLGYFGGFVTMGMILSVPLAGHRHLAAAALATFHMTPLEKIIGEIIAAEGPMPIDRYMGLCLGHPVHGYYMSARSLWRAGGFHDGAGDFADLWRVDRRVVCGGVGCHGKACAVQSCRTGAGQGNPDGRYPESRESHAGLSGGGAHSSG